jgi:tRNA(fMet)-specific endonuclease VapC
VTRQEPFILDTDICVYLLNGKAPAAESRLRGLPRDSVGVTAITVAELRYGALNSVRPQKNMERVHLFASPLRLFPFGDREASAYAAIRTDLRRRGLPIGAMDMLIAATCITAGAVLVTNNVREFARVPGLTVDNWAD